MDESLPLLLSKQQGAECIHGINGASFAGAVFNLSTNIIGAGIMSLPAAMKTLGLVPGITIIILVAFLAEASIGMLLNFSKTVKSDTYGGVMGDAFGWRGKMLLQFCVAINNIGVLIVYMIIIGDVLSGTSSSGVHHSGVLDGWFGAQWWNGRTFVLLIITFFVFVPLASFKRVDSLGYSSALSVALAVVFVIITAYVAIVKLISGSVEMPRWFPQITDLTSFWKLFTVVPVLVTAYICHYNVHSIDKELGDDSRMRSAVRSSLVLCTILYITTSLFALLIFGERILDDVLANFNSNLGIPYSSFLNDIVRLSYAFHLMLVFPIILFPLRFNIDGLFFPSAQPLSLSNSRFISVTAVLIFVIFLGANFIPSIWDVFQFTGATATVCIGFIFPAAIALRDSHKISTKSKKIFSLFMIVLASFSNGVAIYSDAYSLWKKIHAESHG